MSLIDPSTPPASPFRAQIRHDLAEIRRNWVAFLVIGIALVALGSFLIVSPWVGTLASIWVLSIALVVGGLTEIVGAFWVRRWSGFFAALLVGVLHLALGVLIFDRPVAAAATLTLVVAAFLVVGGIFRVAVALSLRYAHWGWSLISGMLSLVLGLLIWRQWPEASLWVIGLFVGLEVVITGWSWVMLALLLRRLPKAA